MGRKDAPKKKGDSKTLQRLQRRKATDTAVYRLRASNALRDLLLTSLSGVMVFMSYPNYDLWPLQWFALIPLMWVIRDKTPWKAFGWGLWSGLVTNWGGFYWVTGMLMDFGHFSLTLAIPLCTLMCAYQGLIFAIWAGLTRWVVRGTGLGVLWVAPVAWAVAEFALPFIFPWYLANGQYLFYPAIQITELTGVIGLSYIIVFVNAGLFLGVLEALDRRWSAVVKPVAIAVGLFTSNVVYGVVRMHQVDALMEDSPSLKIGVGEADVGIWDKEAKGLSAANQVAMLRGNILKHHLLAAELEKKHKVDLIVEPESSFIPVGSVGFKREGVFAVAGGRGANLWELRDSEWSDPLRTDKDVTQINGLTAAREDQVFAVGNSGLIMRRVGDSWVTEASGVRADLHSVWATEMSPDDYRIDAAPVMAMAVGTGGMALLRENGQWIRIDTGVTHTLRAVSATGSAHGFAVGDHGTVLRWNGGGHPDRRAGWQRETSRTTANLRGVWIAADGQVTAVGDQGVVLTRRSGVWRKHVIPGGQRLNGVTGDLAGRVVVGNRGGSWRWSGSSWRSLKTPVSSHLRGVSIDGRGHMYAVGDQGVLLQLKRGTSRWMKAATLRKAGSLRAVTGVPYTEAPVYGRDARYVARSHTPLPKLGAHTRMEAVADPTRHLITDGNTPRHQWNAPIRGFDTPILLGLLTYELKNGGTDPRDRHQRRTYNSAMLLDADGRVLGRYDKNYLLIFGEYIPFGETFPQLYEWLPEASHFYAGDTVETFEFKGHQIGVMICYEDIIPRFTRRLAGKDPNVLINVTNDAWFGKTSEPYLHLALAVFRAVENRLWLIRSTNTGVSAFVDGVGRIVGGTGLEDPETLVFKVPMMSTATLYRSYGDLFAYVCLLVFGGMVVAVLRRRKRESRGAKRG